LVSPSIFRITNLLLTNEFIIAAKFTTRNPVWIDATGDLTATVGRGYFGFSLYAFFFLNKFKWKGLVPYFINTKVESIKISRIRRSIIDRYHGRWRKFIRCSNKVKKLCSRFHFLAESLKEILSLLSSSIKLCHKDRSFMIFNKKLRPNLVTFLNQNYFFSSRS
jgi:hypothetical protein